MSSWIDGVENASGSNPSGNTTGPHLHFQAGKAEIGGPLYPESSEKAVDGATTGITETSAVNHPLHYNQDPSGVECIQIVRHRNYNIGSAFKYLWRHGLKDADAEIEDLEKAAWHIRDEIDRLEGEV